MDPLTIGCLGCAAFVALIFLRVPIAYGMIHYLKARKKYAAERAGKK